MARLFLLRITLQLPKNAGAGVTNSTVFDLGRTAPGGDKIIIL
jgi:hypothetical protein